MFDPVSGTVATVSVETTNNGGHPPEFWAKRLADRIMYVSQYAPPPIRDQAHHRTRVRIGQGAWIGSAAVVMADVGRNSVVGAGAVVTKPLPDDVVAAGVPARVVRTRTTAADPVG